VTAGDATGTVAGHTAVAAAGHIVCTVAVAGHHNGRTVVAVVGHHIGRTVAAVAAADRHIVHTVDCLRLRVEHHNKAVPAGRIECIVAAVGRTA